MPGCFEWFDVVLALMTWRCIDDRGVLPCSALRAALGGAFSMSTVLRSLPSCNAGTLVPLSLTERGRVVYCEPGS